MATQQKNQFVELIAYTKSNCTFHSNKQVTRLSQTSTGPEMNSQSRITHEAGDAETSGPEKLRFLLTTYLRKEGNRSKMRPIFTRGPQSLSITSGPRWTIWSGPVNSSRHHAERRRSRAARTSRTRLMTGGRGRRRTTNIASRVQTAESTGSTHTTTTKSISIDVVSWPPLDALQLSDIHACNRQSGR